MMSARFRLVCTGLYSGQANSTVRLWCHNDSLIRSATPGWWSTLNFLHFDFTQIKEKTMELGGLNLHCPNPNQNSYDRLAWFATCFSRWLINHLNRTIFYFLFVLRNCSWTFFRWSTLYYGLFVSKDDSVFCVCIFFVYQLNEMKL